MKTDRFCGLEQVATGDLIFYFILSEMDGSSGLS